MPATVDSQKAEHSPSPPTNPLPSAVSASEESQTMEHTQSTSSTQTVASVPEKASTTQMNRANISEIPVSRLQTRIINHLSDDRLFNDSHSTIIAPSGTGKTVAAVISMLRNVDVNKKSLQAFFLTITFEGAVQASYLASYLCPDVKLQIITSGTTTLEVDAQCIVGASMDVHTRFELFSNAITGAHQKTQMFFDDGDTTMNSEKVRTCLLKHISKLRIHYISSFRCTRTKDMNDALSPMRNLNLNIDVNSNDYKFHYGIVESLSDWATVIQICELQSNTKNGVLIICKVYLESYLEMSILYIGPCGHSLILIFLLTPTIM